MPVGVVYTTFHHPVTGANVVTTEHSDWATNCPEYKVTAVQVAPVHASVAVATGAHGHRVAIPTRTSPAWRTRSPTSSCTSAVTTATAAVVNHLRLFWEPQIRAQLLALVDAGSDALDPVVVEAAGAFRSTRA